MPQHDGKDPTASLWRNSDYVGWWAGNTCSALGTSVSAISYPLLVLSLTGSVTQAGLIGSANLLGVLVMTLWGGAIADRVSRRGTLVIGSLVQAALLGAVALTVHEGFAHVPTLAAASLLSGLCSGIILGASTPALRRLVPKEQLATANGQAMGRDMAAQLVGPPLGGVLFAAGRSIPFLFDALSFVVAALGALRIRRPLGPDRDDGAPETSMLKDVGQGIGFVARQPFLRFVVIMASLLNMVDQAFMLLLIAIVRERGGNAATIGIITGVAVAGSLVGAVIAPLLTKRIPSRRLTALAVVSFTGGLALTAVVPEVWQIGVVVTLAGLAAVPLNVVLQTYVMHLVPDRLLGRVAAVNRFGAYSLEWLGPTLAGGLVIVFGVSGGILSLLVVMVPLCVVVLASPALNILRTPIEEITELADNQVDMAADEPVDEPPAGPHAELVAEPAAHKS
ncbi:MFS transporter [Streptomyces sp. NPDC052052]|uniref:MFS transporter n=1 Tax=Streptomyces sp. NPDC052052 TaxID=3154756 RepID=UPI00342C8FEF